MRARAYRVDLCDAAIKSGSLDYAGGAPQRGGKTARSARDDRKEKGARLGRRPLHGSS